MISFGATRGLSAFLLAVSAFDPTVFSGVTTALAAAALAASLGPARRAMRVDPLVAEPGGRPAGTLRWRAL